MSAASTRRYRPRTVRIGAFANGMEYSAVGSGPKALLFIQGGPGGTVVPSRAEMRMVAGSVRTYLDDGYTVWGVTRRRGMPRGYSVADMAEDYARVIREELGGRVDVVVAEEFGGMIGQQLAAAHPDLLTHLALVRTAWRVTQWGRDVDGRFGEALSAGRCTGAGVALLEEVAPGARWQWLRRVLGPLAGRWLAGRGYNLPDVLVETHAERDFDGRDVLSRIRVPVVVICGEKDRIFAQEDAAELARLIPDSTLIRYPGERPPDSRQPTSPPRHPRLRPAKPLTPLRPPTRDQPPTWRAGVTARTRTTRGMTDRVDGGGSGGLVDCVDGWCLPGGCCGAAVAAVAAAGPSRRA